MGRLTAIVLGAAAGGGFPQWNCRCPVCALAWAGDPRVKPRTQAGLAVSVDGESWLLCNASPDLRAQILATSVLHPNDGLRDSPVAAVVLTGGEIDQTAGLLTLRERQPFALYATAATHAAIADNPVFSALGHDVVSRVAVAPGQRFTPLPSMSIEVFTAPGKMPLYLEGDNPEIGDSAMNIGLEIECEGRRLVFIPGAAALTPALEQRLASTDAILFDGTLFTDDEMIASGTGEKTGRRMGHMPIDGPGGSLATLSRMRGRRIYIHINNTNPVLIEDSPERRRVESAGVEIAEDGMEIVL